VAGPQGNRARACPSCLLASAKMRIILLSRHLVESKIPGPGPDSRETITGPHVRWVCKECGYGEIELREPRERREAKGDTT
jgi:hypothetical protein